ncbi:MAG: ATP-grasp domain-containing protein [Pseudomonadota bacterium]
MQWILQDFEDTRNLAKALEQLGFSHSWHKVVPFVSDLIPEPDIDDPGSVVLFGSYTLWRYAERHALKPGVFRIRPFVRERAWHPVLLNGADAAFLTLKDIPDQLKDDGREWFMRPVTDSKEVPGKVLASREILSLSSRVLSLDEDEIPLGSLRPDTELMLTPPVRILKEWRCWIVGGRLVTFSLYKEGSRIVYRPEIDDDAREFAERVVELNADYSPAYVVDICRTDDGLRMLETNCINAAGFYAADLVRLCIALDEQCSGSTGSGGPL